MTWLAIARLNAANYNGATFYFEVIGKVASGTCTVGCYDIGDAANETTVSVTATKYTRYRSAAFTPTAGDRDYRVYVSGGTSPLIISAKIIILQSATDITDTETQIEVGQHWTGIPAAINTWYPLTEPKYWKYESSKWDPAPAFKLGFTIAVEDDRESYILGLEYDDGAFTWSGNVVAQVSGISSESVIYYESAAFTPTNGLHYRLVYQGDDAKDDIYLYNAKVIGTQVGERYFVDVPGSPAYTALYGVNGGSGVWEEMCQNVDIPANAGGDLRTLKLYLNEQGAVLQFLTAHRTTLRVPVFLIRVSGLSLLSQQHQP
jgi:hypothetical protein